MRATSVGLVARAGSAIGTSRSRHGPTPALLLATGALLVTLVAGIVAHEAAHALVLRAFGVRVDVVWLPDRGRSAAAGASSAPPVVAGVLGRWACVTPRTLPPTCSPWALRLAALAPLALAGLLPDPVQSGSLPLSVAAFAWFACALPSPQDFSLVWHAEAAIAEHAGPSTG